MNVVPFPAPASRLQPGWHRIELQQLLTLYAAAHAHTAKVASWDVDTTETDDPQFYLLGPAPAQDCLACISRVDRLYVLEDGAGTVLGEDRNLAAVIDTAVQRLAPRRGAAFVTRMILLLCAVRVMIDEKLEPLIPDSTEMLVRAVPPLAAIV